MLFSDRLRFWIKDVFYIVQWLAVASAMQVIGNKTNSIFISKSGKFLVGLIVAYIFYTFFIIRKGDLDKKFNPFSRNFIIAVACMIIICIFLDYLLYDMNKAFEMLITFKQSDTLTVE